MYQKFWKPLGLTILILLLLPISLWAAPVGKVSHIEGEADVTTPDGKIALVKAADPVSVGDILRTKAKSKVEVAFADGNTVFIAERSRLRITAYDNREDKNSTLDLFRGKTRVVVNNLAKKSAIELHTPTAVAGVRGTIWIGTFENGVSTFFFERGEGYGYNKNMPEKIVTIRAGQTMEVRGPDQPPVVRPTPIYELNRHLLDTTASRLQGQTGETPPPVPGTGEPGAPAPSRPSGQTQEETLIPSPEQYLELPPEPLPPPELPPLPPPPEPAPILPPPPPPPDTTPIIEPIQPIGGGDLLTDMTGAFAGFSGTFDGSITGGTLSMAGTFDSGTTASTSSINGTGYDGYLAGIPGSWEGLFDAFYSPTAGSVQFLSGSLSDPNFINTAGASLNASGPLSLDPQSYTTSGGYTAFADGPMLVFEHITQFPEAIPVFGSVSGYRTSTDWIVAVGAASTTGGVYESLGPSWTRTFGGYWMREDETNSYAFLGEIEGTDDGVGHLAIRSTTPTRYMDEAYMGTINLRYRGVYTEALIGEPEPMPGYSYDSIGTAQYVLEPLAFSGFVGRNTANAFLYYRPPSDLGDAQITRDGSASMAGLIGGTNAMGSQFLAMGSYISYGIGHSIFDVDLDLYNYNTGLYSLKAYFSGYGIEDSIHGRILGLYRLPSDSGEELGWITGTTGTGTVPLGTTSMIYPEASAWETWGTLTYLPKVQASGLPDTITTESLEGSVRANTTAGVVSGSRSFFDGESWGIINAAFGGNYSADPTMPTDFQLGGTLSGGYWLADFTIASPSPSSSTFFDTPIQGRLLTETQYATFTPYSYAMGKINDPEDNAIYTGIFLAPYEGHPLLFNGSVSEGYFWRVDPADGPDKNGIINFLEGLVGGTATLYGGLLADGRYSAVPVAGMGSYKNIGDGGLFLDPLFLVRMTGQDLTLGATNAYTLLAGGVTPGYTLVGGMKGMYWRPAGTGSYEFGFIIGQGEDPAELYPNLEQPMWTLGNDAQLQAYRLFPEVASTSNPGLTVYNYPPVIHSSPIDATDITGWAGGAWAETSRQDTSLAFTVNSGATTMNWGLTSRILGGTYATEEGDPPINNKTPPPAGAQWNHIEPLTATGQAFAKVTIEERIDNTFEASLAGAQVYFGSETPGEDTAWISLGGAEMTGIFDPLASTWQAVALTAGIKVPEFMNKISSMTTDQQRQAFYEATNIPAFNVGATDLRGSLGGVYLGSATDPTFGIKNVTFFAPTSGAKPQIWASGGTSGGVSGTFTGTPSALTVPLQGFAVGSGSVASPASTNGITASFNVEKWGAAAGQNWGATITNGAAPENALTGATGYTTANVITFEGGATGTIISAPGGAPGTFSGTAAGIVK